MDEKNVAPPAYSEASSYSAGYAPPPGNQGAPGGGYPPPAAGGYGSNYPPQQYGYGQQPGYPNQYGQTNYGFQSQTAVVMNQPVGGSMVVNSVPDQMGLAIFTTICCCWPLGIIAILRAQESRRALDSGDLASASRYSQESRRYSMFAIAGGCVSILLAIIIIVVVVTTNTRRYYDYDY